MKANKVSWFFLLIGAVIIGTAFFAEAIGLDNDPGWGNGRIAILAFGIFVAAGGIFSRRYADKLLYFSHQIQLHVSRNVASLLKLFQGYWYTFPVVVFVILVYIWFASSGSWTDWVSPTRYYADLANSFERGKPHLLTQPGSDLLNLSNPYDPLTRQNIEFPIDYSLYNGKFYLYWGPAPALILVIINPFVQGRVGDLYLIFSFVCGIFLLQYLLAIMIWNRFFPDLPKWILALSILVIGLMNPWTYMLINEPNGRIYEAAISGAQFFLIGGFWVAANAFHKPVPSSFSLALTGFLWALAIGTRFVIALPIGFMVLMIAYRIWSTARSSPMPPAIKLFSLGLPLFLGFIGLGWYNWARFGSLTETGFSYALAGVNLQKYQNELFLPVYIIQNLYNYLLQPPASMPQFPFLYSQDGIENAILPFYSLPAVYETSPVTGLLFVAPFIIFAVVPIAILFTKTASKDKTEEKDNSDHFLNWLMISLFGASFLAFCLLLVFFWAAMRYIADFMPLIAMASAVGFWQGYRFLAHKPIYQRMYSIVGIMFASTSVIINILLSISVKQLGRIGF